MMPEQPLVATKTRILPQRLQVQRNAARAFAVVGVCANDQYRYMVSI